MRDAVRVRPARRSDAADIVILLDMATDALSSWVWLNLRGQPGRGAVASQIGRELVLDETSDQSWRNVVIAEVDHPDGGIRTAGMALAYRIAPDEAYDVAFETFLDGVLAPGHRLIARVRDSFYFDSLSLYPEFRRYAVVRRLVDETLDRAHASGASTLSGIVRDDNRVLALHKRNGMRERAREPFVSYPLLDKSAGDWVLLTMPLVRSRPIPSSQ